MAYEVFVEENGGVPGRTGGLPRRSPLRTVRATHRGTRLKQAGRALQVEALVSCAGGRAAATSVPMLAGTRGAGRRSGDDPRTAGSARSAWRADASCIHPAGA